MTKYCVGFLFNVEHTHVALIKKRKPTWQKGFLNGIGGHVEDGESFEQAMTREFYEEAGLYMPHWFEYLHMFGSDPVSKFEMGVFRSHVPDSVLRSVITASNEGDVGVYSVSTLHDMKTLPNLQWLIPMALTENSLQVIDKAAA